MGRLANWLVLPAVLASWEFNFGNFGPGEEIVIFSDVLQKQGTLELALWDTSLSPNEASLVPLSCRKVRQLTFENSDEPLPITRSGYNYMACHARRALPHLTAYGLACREAGQWRFDATETIVYDANQAPRERYEDTIHQSLNAALSVDRSVLSDVELKVTRDNALAVANCYFNILLLVFNFKKLIFHLRHQLTLTAHGWQVLRPTLVRQMAGCF